MFPLTSLFTLHTLAKQFADSTAIFSQADNSPGSPLKHIRETTMKLTNNTILITGGGSGIGRGLAEAFHAQGNKVIIAGRRQKVLDETTTANPGMVSMTLDMEDPTDIRAFAAQVVAEYPELNVLINNAGIMRQENLKEQQEDLDDAEATIATNLLGPIRLTAALLPHFQKQARSTIMNVSSGLAFVPLPHTPTYSATKAAIHSYTQCLRTQLENTSVEVLELIPPAVRTDLFHLPGAADHTMPLDEFIKEVMQIIEADPPSKEICVERVKFLRFAAATGSFDTVFGMLGQL